MPNKSLFPGGTPVGSQDLQRVETERVAEDNARLVALSQTGIVSGLVVTRNTVTTTHLDVSAGSAYAPNGALVTVPSTELLVPLADATNLTVNLVCLVYTETTGDIRGHESDGTARATSAAPTYRLLCLTQTQYDALVATSTDMSVNTTDRTVLLARVLGNGIGIALNTNEITQGAALTNWNDLTANISTFFFPPNITGLTVGGISQTTFTGQGTLTYAYPAQTITWASPTSTGSPGIAGVAVAVGAGGTFTLTSGAGETISITIDTVYLPVTGAVDAVTVDRAHSEEYGQQLTALDRQHRQNTGLGQTTTVNPHGMAPTDFGGSNLPFPQLLNAGSNFLGSVANALLPRWLSRSRVGGSDFTLHFQFQVSANNWLRCYTVTGATYIVLGARFDGSLWQRDADATRAVGIRWLSGSLEIIYNTSASFATPSWSNWARHDDLGRLTLGLSALATTAASVVTRIALPFRDTAVGDRTRLISTYGTLSSFLGVASVYVTYNGVTAYPEFVVNAEWNAGTSMWEQSNPADVSYYIYVHPTLGANILQQAAGAGPWAIWPTALISVGASGNLTVAGDVNVGDDLVVADAATVTGALTAATLGWTTTQSFVKSLPGCASIINLDDYATTGGGAPFPLSVRPIEHDTANFQTIWVNPSSETTTVLWPIELPDGVTITGAVLHGTILTVGSSTFSLVRVGNGGGFASLGSVAYTNVSSTVSASELVANGTYCYYARVILGSTTTAANMFRVEIMYDQDVLTGA